MGPMSVLFNLYGQINHNWRTKNGMHKTH